MRAIKKPLASNDHSHGKPLPWPICSRQQTSGENKNEQDNKNKNECKRRYNKSRKRKDGGTRAFMDSKSNANVSD
jgi:hypothetical protein